MLQAVLNNFWKPHLTKQQLYGYQPPTTKTIKVRRTRHARHSWRSKDELISDILPWTPSYIRAKTRWPARTYIKPLCADTGYSLEDLLENRDGWRERAMEIHSGIVAWWWWCNKFPCDILFYIVYFRSPQKEICKQWRLRLHSHYSKVNSDSEW